MEYLASLTSKLPQNFNQSMIAGASGALATKYIYGSSELYFESDYLNWLNGYDSAFEYFAIFAGSNMAVEFTGDFVQRFVPGPFSIIAQQSKPLSVGLIALGAISLLNGQIMPLDQSLMIVALGAGSNIVSDYLIHQINRNIGSNSAFNMIAPQSMKNPEPLPSKPVADHGITFPFGSPGFLPRHNAFGDFGGIALF
jgi:hypothetical protein